MRQERRPRTLRNSFSRFLPTTLADLVPEYLPSIPADPFDGRELRYRITREQPITLWKLTRRDGDISTDPVYETQPMETTGHGYLVYSIGRDRVDNGDTSSNPNGTGARSDITFTINR